MFPIDKDQLFEILEKSDYTIETENENPKAGDKFKIIINVTLK